MRFDKRSHYMMLLDRTVGVNRKLQRSGIRALLIVTAPKPHESLGQGLLEHATIAVAGAEAEDEPVVVTFGRQRRRGAFAGHDPIVMGFLGIFWTQIVFRDVCEKDLRKCPNRRS